MQRPSVDILVVTYNSRRWVKGLLSSLAACDYPKDRLRLLFVDNDSSDETVAYLEEQAKTLPFTTEVIASGVNGGFTGGYRIAFQHAHADYWFVLNQDTEPAVDAISLLVETLEAEPDAGIAEARQSPREHPKYYDPFTRETSWCSGACMMLRAEAVSQVGGFDTIFFMYAEDVDLSWRMWLHGWKCLYVSEAVVQHFTEDLDSKRLPYRQHYYSMRNGAIMRVAYGTVGEAVRHYVSMLGVALSPRQPLWHRWGTIKGLIASLTRLPAALRKRWSLPPRHQQSWVSFNGWYYGRHLTDLDCLPAADPPATTEMRSVVVFESFRDAVLEQSRDQPWLTVDPHADVDGTHTLALLTHQSASFHFELEVEQDAWLTGWVGNPASTDPSGRGTFTVEQDGRQLFRLNVCRATLGQSGWIPFAVRLEPTCPEQTTRLRFGYTADTPPAWHRSRRREQLEAARCAWGYWAGLTVSSHPPQLKLRHSGMKITVVVPTHNRADGLIRMVQRLLAQDFDPETYELVLVDSCSNDHTLAVLQELATDPRVQAFRCEKKGAAAARNVGLEHARGELVVLMDDDILVRRDFLTRLWSAHQEDPDRVLLARIVHPFEDEVDPFLRFLREAQEVNVYNFPDPTDVPADYFFTGCVAIPRAVLGDIRFDEGFRVYGVEDIDFGHDLLRTGTRMSFLPDLEVWHDYYPRFEYFKRKKFHAGFSLGYYLHKRPWRRVQHMFQRKLVKYSELIRWAALLTKPFALFLEVLERVRYKTGPINRWLYLWYKASIRVEQYSGYLMFDERDGDLDRLPTLGYRGASGVRAITSESPQQDQRAA